MNRIAYTALFGGYENLNEQAVARESDMRFVCFTDDPNLTSETWEIVHAEPLFPFDLVRSQREVKIRGNELTRGAKETLYLDNSVTLEVDPETILDDWLSSGDMGLCSHNVREHVIDEFDEVIALHYDDPARIQEQLMHYAELYPSILEERPYWNGLMARRNTPLVQQTMEFWFDHVLRFSRRDQLSANVSFAVNNLQVLRSNRDANRSDYHFWPTDVQRKDSMRHSIRERSAPLLAEVARLRRELGGQERKLVERSESIAELLESLRMANEAIARAESDVVAIQNTSSWKITAPLRRVRSLLGRSDGTNR